MSQKNSFTIYNASAGSGKTYTLVKEYIVILLKADTSDSYKNILAITFTNKAVAEMKSRVIATLYKIAISTYDNDLLLRDLQSETNLSIADIKSRTKNVLKSILHNYAAFDISTIDRFTHKIIRTFAKDLGIPINFEVELNIQQILKEAVDRVINNAGEDKKLTKALLSYTLDKADDDKSWDISRDLFKFSGLLTQETHQPFVNLLKGKTLLDFEDYSHKLKKELKTVEDQISDVSAQFFDIINSEGLERLDFNAGHLFNYFSKLEAKNYAVSFGAKYQEQIEDEPLYAKKVAAHKKEILDQNQEVIAMLFKTSRALIFKREYLKEILKNLNPLSLLSEISNEIENIKKERSLVLISDFNPTIAKEINNQPAPFIYERLGERYKNYFIDEFQDTSEMQWLNMIPLIDHALSTEQVTGETSSLTLVGDAKQSIYRFRGGKAEQFIDLYNHKNPFNVEKNLHNLPSNYRSAEEIVKFNNSFFSYISDKFDNPLYRELFKNSSQEVKIDLPGYVNISFLESEKKEDEFEIHPERALEIINDLDGKGYSKGDICILTRTRKESFAMANYLSERGVSIVSSESLLVSNSPEVHFINAIFEFSQNPTDKNIKWNILNYFTHSFQIADPHRIIAENIEKNDQDFFDWLSTYNINFNIEEIRFLSMYEAAEYIIRTFSLIKTSNAYVQFYLDYIFEKVEKNSIGIQEFLELWEQDKDKLSIIAPKTEDAVIIMTIHKSKGLEFPIVIYPFANTKLKDVSREHLWLPLPEGLDDIPVGYLKASDKMLNWGEIESSAYQEKLEQSEFDNINVLYVAFTRASKQLYILSNLALKKGQEDEKVVSGLLIGYLKSKNLWDDAVASYDFGTIAPESSSSKEPNNTIKQEYFFSSPTRSNSVKIVTNSSSLWDSVQEEAINKGLLVHNIMSEVDTAKDLPAAFNKFTSEEDLSKDELLELEKLISAIFTHPEIAEYYSDEYKIIRERDIIDATGEILRPDRLNIKDNKVTIIDYKTGNIQPYHQQQMNEYAHVISKMDFEVSNKILIYINNEVNITFV